VFSSAQGKIALRPHTEKYLAWGVEDNGGGRLLGVELVLFGEGDADLLGVEQCQQLLLVGKAGQAGQPKE